MTRQPMTQLTLDQRVFRFIQEQHLLTGQPELVVAVSGGPDSVCLLHIMNRLSQQLGISLHAAHLNHQLRSADAEADARYVADVTRKLGIPATIERRDVKAYQARKRLSLEEAAREVRYKFLAEVAQATGADRVAVGHTTDDHVETILMHLIRGGGTRGLRGLQPVSHLRQVSDKLTVIRPLLEISREETAAYCHRYQLMPRLDTSNLSLSPLRNRIRQQLIPLLQSYNPKVTEAILRTGRLAGDELAFLEEETDRVWDEVAAQRENTIILDKERLCQLNQPLKRQLLRACLEKLLGDLKDIEAVHIEGLINTLDKPAGKQITLPKGLTFAIEYDRYLLGREPLASSPFPALEGEAALNIPGATRLNECQVTASIISKEQVTPKDNEFTACLDFDKTGDKLTVRHRQPGDRLQPLGMSQDKKLNEFMIDARIPHSWRQHIPIVCSPDHIVWIVGWRIDERAKVTEDTERVLRLEFKQG